MRTYEEYSKLLGPYVTNFKKGGSPIHIKKANEGKFTASAKSAGMSVQAYAQKVLNDPNASGLEKKRANFALVSRRWNHKHKHGGGGYIKYFDDGDKVRGPHFIAAEKINLDFNDNANKLLPTYIPILEAYVDVAEKYDNWLKSTSENYEKNTKELKNAAENYEFKRYYSSNVSLKSKFPELPPLLKSKKAFNEFLRENGAKKYNYEFMELMKNVLNSADNVFPNYKGFKKYLASNNEENEESATESTKSSNTLTVDATPETYSPPDLGEQRDAVFGFNNPQSSTQEPTENTPSSESTASSEHIDPYDLYSSQKDDYYLSQQLDDPLYDYFNVTSRHSYPYRRHSRNRYNYSLYDLDSYSSSSSYNYSPYSYYNYGGRENNYYDYFSDTTNLLFDMDSDLMRDSVRRYQHSGAIEKHLKYKNLLNDRVSPDELAGYSQPLSDHTYVNHTNPENVVIPPPPVSLGQGPELKPDNKPGSKTLVPRSTDEPVYTGYGPFQRLDALANSAVDYSNLISISALGAAGMGALFGGAAGAAPGLAVSVAAQVAAAPFRVYQGIRNLFNKQYWKGALNLGGAALDVGLGGLAAKDLAPVAKNMYDLSKNAARTLQKIDFNNLPKASKAAFDIITAKPANYTGVPWPYIKYGENNLIAAPELIGAVYSTPDLEIAEGFSREGGRAITSYGKQPKGLVMKVYEPRFKNLKTMTAPKLPDNHYYNGFRGLTMAYDIKTGKTLPLAEEVMTYAKKPKYLYRNFEDSKGNILDYKIADWIEGLNNENTMYITVPYKLAADHWNLDEQLLKSIPQGYKLSPNQLTGFDQILKENGYDKFVVHDILEGARVTEVPSPLATTPIGKHYNNVGNVSKLQLLPTTDIIYLHPEKVYFGLPNETRLQTSARYFKDRLTNKIYPSDLRTLYQLRNDESELADKIRYDIYRKRYDIDFPKNH